MRFSKGLFVVLACIALLLVSSVKDESQAACIPPAKIVGNSYPASSIQDAYDYASTTLGLTDFTLRLSGETFTEDIFLDGGTVEFDGGYDCSFTTKNSTSSILGAITISTGAAKFAGDVDVVSIIQCAFDVDGDGYTSIGSCSGSADDCNDNDADVNPGAVEICDDIDNNCDGQIEEGLTPTDFDGDGYYDAGLCAGVAEDCNDNDTTIHPDALETPYDGIDQDCNGADLIFAEALCTVCHGMENTWTGLHTNTVAPDGTCATCHAANVGNILAGHYGDTVRTAGNNMTAGFSIVCASCHDGDTAQHAGGANVVWSKVEAALPITTCDTCHENRASGHVSATAHDMLRIIDSSCGSCHTSDTSVLGFPGTGTLATAADVDILHRSDCGLCHNFNGSVAIAAKTVRQVIQLGLSGNQIICTACHTDKRTGHADPHVHTVGLGPNDLSYDAPGQPCSDCHVVATWDDIEGVEHNVPTNGAGTCTTCHYSTRQEVIDAIALGANPTNCLACHSDKDLTQHGNEDHVALGYVTGGATPCLTCHDPGAAANATVSVTHLNNCNICHTVVPALQPGIPVGGGDCTICHASTWDVTHAVNTPDHGNLVQVSTTDCGNCHYDPPPLTDAANPKVHSACFSCHDVNGALISLAVGQDFTTGGDCVTCHTGTWEASHPVAPDHTSLVTVGSTSCAICHNDTLVGVDSHFACTSCHDATTGALLSLAIGQSFIIGNDCTTCHTSAWEATHATNTPDHSSLVQVATTSCASCHVDTLVSGAADTHNNCSSCHDVDGALISLAIGQDFITGGDCASCHTGTWDALHTIVPDHTPLVTVSATTCGICHDDTLVGVESHADCISCHDATTGARISSAIGQDFTTGGSCVTCHTNTWEVTHTTNTPSHNSLVTVSGTGTTGTGCAYCHPDPPPLVEAVNPENHNACGSCHDVNGALISSAVGQDFATGGDCNTCHSSGFDVVHTAHAHTVELGPGDLSFDAPGQPCSNCHAVADWSEIEGILHNIPTNGAGSCTTCHDSPRQEVIDAITLAANPTNCLPCHSNKYLTPHLNADHDTLGYVVGGTTPCMTCHDPGPGTNLTVTIIHNSQCSFCHLAPPTLQPGIPVGGGDCVACHTNTWDVLHTTNTPSHNSLVQVASTSCGNCHSDPPPLTDAGDPKNHNVCSSCHDVDGGLISSAVGKTFAAGGDCATCHTGTWEAEHPVASDHTGIVTVASTSCAGCHDDTLVSVAADTHNACASCHDATTGALISIATGQSAPGDCTSCHGTDWLAQHTGGPDHTALVTVAATSCGNCHSDPPPLTDVGDPQNHNACASCHNGIGGLISSAIGKTFAAGGDCATCHTGTWEAEHPVASDHTGIVTVASTSCAGCHNDTLVSAAVDTHNACASCHNAADGALISIATAQAAPGDCETCHASGFDTIHTAHAHTVALGSGDLSHVAPGQPCTNCHVVSTWAEIEGVEHNVPTNGTGSCATCHNSPRQEVIDTIALGADPTNCLPCHSNKDMTPHGSADHITLGYVTGGTTPCLSCHDPGGSTNETVTIIHHSNCSLCHTAPPALLPGVPVGGGDCLACHTDTWDVTHTTNPPSHNSLVQVAATSCASCHSDPPPLTDAGDPKVHNACASCHDANGGLVSSAAGKDFTTGGDCATCHTGGFDTTHTGHTHTVALDAAELSGGLSCSYCHVVANWTEIDGTEHNVATNGAGSCATCHNSPRIEVMTAIATGADPTNCLDCHATKTTLHGTSDHTALGYVTTTASCVTCHDPGVVDNATVSITHLNNCALCHTTPPFLQPGVPGRGECVFCHSNTWEATHTTNTPDHSNLVQVATTDCANCHDDTLTSAANETHTGCTSCHNVDGSLRSLAIGKNFTTGGNCATCHTGTWEALHTTMPNHTGIVTVASTSCASCHDDTLVSAAADTHNACASCHDANTGALISIAAGQAAPGDCTNCHTDTFDVTHTAHGHTVTMGPSDLSHIAPGQPCSNCHVVSTWLEIEGIEHNVPTNGAGSCATCHNSPRQEVIDAIALGANPTNCLDCHSNKDMTPHGSIDHVALGYVTGGATPCLSCHDTGAPVDGTTITTHLANCALCHTTVPNLQPGIPSGGGDCVTCHTDTWGVTHSTNPPSHNNLVQVAATSCGLCHLDPPPLIDAGDPKVHNACSSCHDVDGNRISSSAGKTFAVGGDCTTCHESSWEVTHTANTPNHTSLVTVTGTGSTGTGCGSCHSDPPPLTDAGDVKVHNACSSCHDVNGARISLAVAKTFAAGGDCATCHDTGYATIHSAHTHTVALGAGDLSHNAPGQPCSNCHVVSNWAEIEGTEHNVPTNGAGSCATCHNSPRQEVIDAIALGANPTNCLNCHSNKNLTVHGSAAHMTLGYVTGGTTPCLSCHDPGGSVNEAVTIIHKSNCALCHTSIPALQPGLPAGGGDCLACHTDTWEVTHTTNTPDHTPLVTVLGTGTTGTGCATCHSDPPPLTDAGDAKVHNACASCHDANGGLISIATGQDFTTGGDCATCHASGFDTTHSIHTHTVQLGAGDLSHNAPGQPCSNCHVVSNWAEIEGTEHNVPTNGAGSCATCHNSPRQEVIDAIALGANPTNCLNCHSNKNLTVHGSAAHMTLGYVTGGTAPCLSCHDPGGSVNEAVTIIHKSNCALCHTSIPALQPGLPAGGGDCLACHTDTWDVTHTANPPSHNSLVTVTGTTCASCHNDPPPLTNPGDPRMHTACSSCHDANGGLISSAAGKNFTTGGNCATCHTSSWEALHTTTSPDHTALVTVVGTGTTGTGCGNCHRDPPPLTDAGDVKVHNTCGSCHDANGGRISSAIGKSFVVGGDCATCHTIGYANIHSAHIHTVALGAGDLSHNAPGQPCSNCHVVSTWVEIEGVEHNVATNGAGSCATCHNSPRQEVIDAIALGADPTNCLNCHSNKNLTVHGSADHMTLGHVTGGATPCLSCHDPGGSVNETVTVIHKSNCALCHTTIPALQPGLPAGGGDCLACHTDTWDATHTANAPSHTTLVTVTGTQCGVCHSDPLPLIDAGDPKVHNACGSCHDSGGALISSAAGKDFTTGGNCSTCHTGTWEANHSATPPSHSSLVQVAATSCGNCHNDPPPLTDAGDAKVHNACGSCHDVDGVRISSASGKTFATGGDCTTCHESSWELTHSTNIPSHNALVTVTGTGTTGTGCGNCHSDPPPLTDAGNTKNHNTCSSCHDANGGLVSTAIGTDFTSGGDCATCHSSGFDSLHGPHTHTIAEGAGDLSYEAPGQLCSDCHTVANWAEINGTEHNVATNGAGSCATCHNSPRQEVIDAITLGANPTNCLNCHSNKNLTIHGSIDHVALGYVTGGATPCLNCHDTGAPVDGTTITTHLANCALCHTTVPNLQPGIPSGGGDCTTCHTDTWDTLHTTNPPNHTALVTVSGTTCALCHLDPPPLTDAGDPKVHNACSSCHDVDGSRISSASGKTFGVGGNCTSCHESSWEVTHTANLPSHTTLVTVNGTGSTGTGCGACHSDPPPLTDGADVKVHNACGSCHDVNGAPISSAIGKTLAIGGDCATCHTTGFGGIHNAHTHTVALGAGDLSHLAPGQPCSNCHVVSTWAEIEGVEHNVATNGAGSCETCHNSPRQEVIDAIALGADPTNCLNCHSNKNLTVHGSADHISLGYVTVGATPCLTCHDPGGSVNETVTLIHKSNCALCHTTIPALQPGLPAGGGDCLACHTDTWEVTHTTNTPDHTPLVTVLGTGTSGTGCATCHSNPPPLTDAGDAKVHNACASCHDANGGLISIATGQDFTTGGDCATCHASGFDSTHSAHTHTVQLGAGDLSHLAPGQPCSNCHVVSTWAEIEGVEHNVATNGAGSCATCHNSPRQEVIDAIALGADPTNCLNCHSNKTLTVHGSADHISLGYVTVGATPCLTCHDPGGSVNETVTVIHKSNCALCHTTIPALQPGLVPGDCVACHTDTWDTTHSTNPPNHNSLVTVTGTTCGVCHTDPPPLVNPGNPRIHDACASCHDSDGGLISSAFGKDFTTGGNCATCHSSSWEITHTASTPDHTALVTINGTGTTGTGCGNCHSDPPPLTDGADAKVHNACGSCHDTDGGRISSATGETFVVGGDCATCHTTGFDPIHSAHTHTVALGAGDLSHNAPGQPCSNCHVVSTWVEIEGTEHNVATNGAGSCATCHNSPRQEVIDAIALGADPTNCLNCHSNKNLTVHGSADHMTLGHVTGGATPCLSCHDPGGSVNETVTVIHKSNCALCHTTIPALQPGLPAGGGDCLACHTDTWNVLHTTNPPSHNSLVTVTGTQCGVCHSDPPPLTDAGDPKVHNACASCHNVDGGLISSAVGKNFTTGGNCSTCHTGSWEATHTTTPPSHNSLVQVAATACGNCHSDPPPLIDAGDAKVHNACASCHDVNGVRISSAAGKTFATGGDCTTCHESSWELTHSTNIPSHNALVQVGASSCASCHSDPPPLTDAGDTKNHNSCSSCHDANGGLVSSAIGKTFAGGGDCASCHTSGFDTIHTAHAHTVSLGAGDQSAGTSCGSCHVVASWSEINGTEHNVPTNGTGSCSTCHSSPRAEVTTAISSGANPTNCLDCHSSNSVNHSDCNTCHDTNGMNHSGGNENAAVHAGHVGSTYFSDCNDCHSNSGPGHADHNNGTVNFNGTAISSADNYSASAGNFNGTCSTNSCHDSGNNQWGTGSALACDDCHAASGKSLFRDRTGNAHSAHVDTSAAPTAYGDLGNNSTQTQYNFSCGECHPTTAINHLNGGVTEIKPSITYNGGSNQCSNVYCHSYIDAGNTRQYQTTPSWDGPGFGSDSCASCHGNSPASNAHRKHEVGFHYKNIYSGLTGILPIADADFPGIDPGLNQAIPDQLRGHGGNIGGGTGASTSTTLTCNVCHYDTVKGAYNANNTTCVNCHTAVPSPTAQDMAVGNAALDIFDKRKHVDGVADVVFFDQKVRTKAQLRDDLTDVPEIGNNWTRVNGYKADDGTSYDEQPDILANMTTWNSVDKTCMSSCHFWEADRVDKMPVDWESGFVDCADCHTDTPR